MSIFSSLSRQQKEAIGLLQIGTFLEYFDLMLYVHMAVLLNELFFPKTDPHTAALLSAFAFCSTYVLRPFGALLFGWIGDNIGRKNTVIITTMIMSISCMVMANLPTYAEIGISAAWIVTICRMVQGMSSMGEVIGCEIYVTEITKPPAQYPAVAFISLASSVGSAVSLGFSTLVTRSGFNWRSAFWIGSCIAVVGSIARIRLRETPEFVDMKRKLQRELDEKPLPAKQKELRASKLRKYYARYKQEKTDKRTIAACFLINCGWPLTFYLGYMYFNPILKNDYGFSPEDIIMNNFILSVIMLVSNAVCGILSYRIHPLKILSVKTKIFGTLILFFPLLLSMASSHYHIFVLQSLLFIFFLGSAPAGSLIIKVFPVFKRFTLTSFLYALSRALVFVVTSFGLIYLTELFGYCGLWGIAVPIIVGFYYSAKYLEGIEEKDKDVDLSSVNIPTLEAA